MRTLSWLERKGVCLGLLWGILSTARWPSSSVLTRLLRTPYVLCEYLWTRFGWQVSAQMLYVVAILLSTGMAYLVTFVVYLWWQRRAIRHGQRASLIGKRRMRRY